LSATQDILPHRRGRDVPLLLAGAGLALGEDLLLVLAERRGVALKHMTGPVLVAMSVVALQGVELDRPAGRG